MQRKLNDKLMLIELSMPTLKMLSKPQYLRFRTLYKSLIDADGKVDLSEWLFYQLLKQHCDRHFGLRKDKGPKYRNVKALNDYYQVVLSKLIYAGTPVDGHAKALGQAGNVSGFYNLELVPKDACAGDKFTKALDQLALAFPLIKPRLIKGLVAAVKSDEQITHREYCLVKGIAAVLDCPLIGLDDLD